MIKNKTKTNKKRGRGPPGARKYNKTKEVYGKGKQLKQKEYGSKKRKKRLGGYSNHKLQSPSEHIPVRGVSRKEAKSRLIHGGLRKYSNCKTAP